MLVQYSYLCCTVRSSSRTMFLLFPALPAIHGARSSLNYTSKDAKSLYKTKETCVIYTFKDAKSLYKAKETCVVA